MNKTFKYESFKEGQEEIISDMIWEVFNEFEAPDYSDEGIRTFKELIKPEHIIEEVNKNKMCIYCCFSRSNLLGVIAFRNINHISLLFVKKSYHKRGIAKKLFKIAISKIEKEYINLSTLTVNSSPYAVNIYRKMGFISIDVMQEKNGILYVPMKKSI